MGENKIVIKHVPSREGYSLKIGSKVLYMEGGIVRAVDKEVALIDIDRNYGLDGVTKYHFRSKEAAREAAKRYIGYQIKKEKNRGYNEVVEEIEFDDLKNEVLFDIAKENSEARKAKIHENIHGKPKGTITERIKRWFQ